MRQGKPIVKRWKRQSRVQCMFPDIFWLTLHMLNKCHPYWDLGFVSSSEKCSGKLNDKNPIAFTLLHCAGKSLSAYNAITFAPRKKDVEVGNGKNCPVFPFAWNTLRNYDFGFLHLRVSPALIISVGVACSGYLIPGYCRHNSGKNITKKNRVLLSIVQSLYLQR